MFEPEIAGLATAIQDAVTRYRQGSPVPTRRDVRVRRRDFSLKYREDFGFANFPPERIEEDVWDWDDQERFQASTIKSLKEYQSLVSALGPNADSVEQFARALSFASFRGTDANELAERVTVFGRELAREPVPVKMTAFIAGLSITESPMVVSDGLTLRRPTLEDVSENVALDEYGGFAFHQPETWFSVIGEFAFEVAYPGLAQDGLLRAIEALRLFRLGGIETNRYPMRSRHSMWPGGVISGPGRYSRFTYALSPTDVSMLSEFLRDVVPLLLDPLHLDKATTANGIAYARYRDALFENPTERALTSAITALEALFLDGETELTHRLAQRVAVFLRALGTHSDARATYDTVRKGYKIRSTFTHGSSASPKDRPWAESNVTILLEYARACILAFLQISTPKDELLRHLDRAMIDPAGVNQLNASLTSVRHK